MSAESGYAHSVKLIIRAGMRGQLGVPLVGSVTAACEDVCNEPEIPRRLFEAYGSVATWNCLPPML